MQIRPIGMLLVALLGPRAIVACAQPANNLGEPAIAASAGSPGTVGAMNGVAPGPALGSSAGAPKLVRHTPGKGAVSQPASGGAGSTTTRSSATDSSASSSSGH
jgi:hypothetical protein